MATQQLEFSNIRPDVRRYGPLAMPRVEPQFPIAQDCPRDQLLKLGRAIRTVRKASGLSQEDLAYEAEIDYSTISEVERGQRNATLLKIMRIARALNVSVAELFAGAGI